MNGFDAAQRAHDNESPDDNRIVTEWDLLSEEERKRICAAAKQHERSDAYLVTVEFDEEIGKWAYRVTSQIRGAVTGFTTARSGFREAGDAYDAALSGLSCLIQDNA